MGFIRFLHNKEWDFIPSVKISESYFPTFPTSFWFKVDANINEITLLCMVLTLKTYPFLTKREKIKQTQAWAILHHIISVHYFRWSLCTWVQVYLHSRTPLHSSMNKYRNVLALTHYHFLLGNISIIKWSTHCSWRWIVIFPKKLHQISGKLLWLTTQLITFASLYSQFPCYFVVSLSVARSSEPFPT